MTAPLADYTDAMRRGHAHAWDQEWQLALAAYKLALQARPSDYTALTSIGLIYLQKQDLPNALSYYRQASHVAPDAVGALSRLGHIYTELDKPNRAAEAYVRLGRRYRQQGINNQALLSYLNAAEAQPTLISARKALAELYKASGNPRNAASEYLAVAHLEQRLGNQGAAQEAVLTAQRLHPASKEVFAAKTTLASNTQALPLPGVRRPLSVSGTRETTQLFGSPTEELRLQAEPDLPSSPLDWALRRALKRASSSLLDMNTEDTYPDDDQPVSDVVLEDREQRRLLVRSLGQALAAYASKDYQAAALGFQRARRAGAQHSALPLLLAHSELQLKKYDFALEEFRSVLNRKRYTAGAYFGMTLASQALREPYDALKYALNALEDIDLTTVGIDRQFTIRTTYANLTEHAMEYTDRDKARALTSQLLSFMSGEDWLHRIQSWRTRLDAQEHLSDSARVLASVYFVIE